MPQDSENIGGVSRTFLYNPLMLFHAISVSLSEDKANKKSIGSSVASDVRDNELTITNELLSHSQVPKNKIKER